MNALAAELADERVAAIARAAARPATVAVGGRPGVGAPTVAAALTSAGLPVSSSAEAWAAADVAVRVIADAPKPEDRAALAAAAGRRLAVLNKADLSGHGPGGPVAVAHRRAAAFAATLGVPAVPLIAHLATAAIDDALVGALRALARTPVDAGTADDFLAAPHPVPAEVRQRLLATLDLIGIAHGSQLVHDRPAVDAAGLTAHLRHASGVGVVAGEVAAALADASYRRVAAGVSALTRLAATSPPAPARRLTAFLTGDELIFVRMHAAAAALGTDASPPVDWLRLAVRWRRAGRGPVSARAAACAADLSRGALRMWDRSGRPS
ncbi:hypothetical protein LV457_06820 [Mycobacterium sp. MYCO198283]|uniref:hypothetical protein n=1 Tax=Mycobacterium sp. MYCO198283 TaxID=2883505 RepID=UPI001E38757C|nr:hypothetical protein [Mycobacterium sp. MYCO198283]MCG5432003.1 hypothetical protein [Mycobacterium sp. MYCO198283]